MREVCFVIDVQGFKIKEGFFPRELAIQGDRGVIFYTFDLPPKKLDKMDKKTVDYCAKFIHGIKWSQELLVNSLPVSAFKELVVHLYKKYSSKEQPLVGVRNGYLKRILIDFGLPIMDMEPLQIEFTNLGCCSFHSFKRRCAINKVMNLYSYIQSSLNNNNCMTE